MHIEILKLTILGKLYSLLKMSEPVYYPKNLNADIYAA
jgi:hypothetical protein